MDAFKKIFGKEYMKVKFSFLWLFVLLNFMYADIFTLMDSSVLKELVTGTVAGLELTEGFLFAAGVLMEIAIAMVVLPLVLDYKWNRWANIIAGIIHAAVLVASLFVGTTTIYYAFFATIEVATLLLIVWTAWNWRKS
jgi:hypothetical protein